MFQVSLSPKPRIFNFFYPILPLRNDFAGNLVAWSVRTILVVVAKALLELRSGNLGCEAGAGAGADEVCVDLDLW